VSVDPTVAYKPKPVGELLEKENILASSNKRDVPDGILTKLIKKKVLDAAAAGESCINKLTVASADAWVLVISIELILLTPSPGNKSSMSTPEATPLWNSPPS
jgi:hypothetical protein